MNQSTEQQLTALRAPELADPDEKCAAVAALQTAEHEIDLNATIESPERIPERAAAPSAGDAEFGAAARRRYDRGARCVAARDGPYLLSVT